MSTEQLKLAQDPAAHDAPAGRESDPLLGKVLDGRYEIQSILGEGGMGLVYKARHVTLGKKLAIKVLKAEVSKDQEIVQRFRQEAQSATSIGNHHIIDISDFGVLPDGSTYFVMEFLDGKSLTKAIEPGVPIKASRTIHIAKQLCRALGAAHDIGIVHRDLKPDNIYLISRGGDPDFVKVLDFGIAKVVGQKSKLTQVGQVFGTPHYMSPEQCAGTAVDKRTDIYALGVIMYEMVSSRVPFDADNLMGILTKHLYEEPVKPRELPPPVDVPPALEAVILKCLVKNADDRYQTMQEVLADLELVEQGLPPSAATARRADATSRTAVQPRPTTGAVATDVTSFELPKSKNTGLFLGAAVVVLLVVGGGIYAFAGGGQEPAPAAQVTPEPRVVPTPEPPKSEPTEPTAQAPTEPAPAEEPVVRVSLGSKPEGAEVFSDKALLGHTPFELERPKHGEPGLDLTLKLAGYKDQTVRVTAYTQEKLTVELDKKRGTASAPPAKPVATPEPAPQPAPAKQEEPAHRPRARPSTEVLDPWN